MTLKLPIPLPYDYVDELLDETYVFTVTELSDDQVICEARFRDPARRTGNYSRLLFSLLDDSIDSEEDEDGYVNYPYSHDGMVWTAEGLSKEEINEILGFQEILTTED